MYAATAIPKHWLLTLAIPLIVVLSGCIVENTDLPAETPDLTEVTREGETLITNQSTILVITDQRLSDDQVIASRLILPVDGWLVVFNEQSGEPGEIIGQTRVEAGVHDDVVVEIESAKITSTLYGQLHATGDPPSEDFRYPGPDLPLEVNGQVITLPFSTR